MGRTYTSLSWIAGVLARTLVPLQLSLLIGAAHAQANYPDKPIRLIIPFAAGNTGELIFRLLTDRKSTRLNSSHRL